MNMPYYPFLYACPDGDIS